MVDTVEQERVVAMIAAALATAHYKESCPPYDRIAEFRDSALRLYVEASTQHPLKSEYNAFIAGALWACPVLGSATAFDDLMQEAAVRYLKAS